jgi:hypothetical protein
MNCPEGCNVNENRYNSVNAPVHTSKEKLQLLITNYELVLSEVEVLRIISAPLLKFPLKPSCKDCELA